MILSTILCYILVIFEQDIVFGAYLTLQAESRENVDVFKKKRASFYLNLELKYWEFKVGILSQYAKLLCGSWL